jgi:hypothetical protein
MMFSRVNHDLDLPPLYQVETLARIKSSRDSNLTAGDFAAIDCEICDALMETENGDIAAETIP